MVIRYYVNRDDAYELHDVMNNNFYDRSEDMPQQNTASHPIPSHLLVYSFETKSNTSFSWLFAFSAISTGSLILTLPLPGWKYTKTLSYVY